MTYKTSFWSPKVAIGSVALPFYTYIELFSNFGGDPSGDDFSAVAVKLPLPVRPLYYAVATLLELAVIALTPALFLLGITVALLHDAVVKLGELFGCCEIDNSNLFSVF